MTDRSARRYWFADSASVEALAAAIDPPRWRVHGVPTLVLAEAGLRERIAALRGGGEVKFAEQDDCVRLLDDEPAKWIQLTSAPWADFEPALELFLDQLARSGAETGSGRTMRIGRCRTERAETPLDAHWIATDLARRLAGEGISPGEIAARAIADGAELFASPLVIGGWFAAGDVSATSEEETRARLARLQAERDGLVFDSRTLRVRQRRMREQLERRAGEARRPGIWRWIAGLFGGSR